MVKKVLRSAEKFSEPFPHLSVTPLPFSSSFNIDMHSLAVLHNWPFQPFHFLESSFVKVFLVLFLASFCWPVLGDL